MTLKFPEITALQILMVFTMALGTTACTPPEPAYPPLVDGGDRDRDRNRRDRNDRDDNRDRNRPQRTGECGKDRICKEICKDIFRSRKDREDCEEFSIADVERMEDVFKILEKPNANDLAEMDAEDLEFLLYISSKPLEKAVDKMSQSEKKRFLVWMAEDSEGAQIIANAEEDYSILKELFGTTFAKSNAELNKNIKSGDSFVELALEEGNEVVLEWIHDFFGDQCESHNNHGHSNYELCVFISYCYLNLSGDTEEEYFEYEFFEDLLDEILSEERKTSGAPAWWMTDTEARDLDSWKSAPHDVCSNRKT